MAGKVSFIQRFHCVLCLRLLALWSARGSSYYREMQARAPYQIRGYCPPSVYQSHVGLLWEWKDHWGEGVESEVSHSPQHLRPVLHTPFYTCHAHSSTPHPFSAPPASKHLSFCHAPCPFSYITTSTFNMFMTPTHMPRPLTTSFCMGLSMILPHPSHNMPRPPLHCVWACP